MVAYNNLLEKALDNTLKMQPYKMDSYRPPRFRLSSSPFCAQRFIFEWYETIKSGNVWNYTSDFYTNIGTAIHSCLQKWIPINNPGLYLGNWKCPKCGDIIEAATGPKFCKSCGKMMVYEEFSFLEKPCISGHCDGIFLANTSLPEQLGVTVENTEAMDKYIRVCKEPIEAVILEYKSAGSYKAKRITDPTPNNKAQAMMYVPCANNKMKELGLNINVVGVIVKYISRDNPNSTSTDFYLPVEDDALLRFNKNIVKLIYKAIKNKNAEYITEASLPCKSKYKALYSDCVYQESCENLRKDLASMFDEVRDDIRKDLIYLKKLGDNR